MKRKFLTILTVVFFLGSVAILGACGGDAEPTEDDVNTAVVDDTNTDMENEVEATTDPEATSDTTETK